MEKDKKYYWLKLKYDFFKRHDVKIIESQPNGEKYVLFYLKLLVESLSHNGELRFNDKIPYDNKMLAIITNTDPDVVKSAMDILINLEFIEVYDNKTIYMVEVEKMIGAETKWAEKKRDHRSKKSIDNAQNSQCLIENEGQSPNEVLSMSDKSIEYRVKSIELEKEKTLKDICRRVIQNLNWQTNHSYKASESNNKYIIARIREGFTEEDCYKVIHNKTVDWLNDDKYSEYLRPSTLFGTKFDSYLQVNDKHGVRTDAELEKLIQESKVENG